MRNNIMKQTPLLRDFIYFFKLSTKLNSRNSHIYSQVMTVCVQQTDFCQGRRDLTRTLQRITSNENKADFQIYF